MRNLIFKMTGILVLAGSIGAGWILMEWGAALQQELAVGESMRMGVSFFVDPAMLDDPSLDDVETITLSYTFFRDLDDLAREEEEFSAAGNSMPTKAN